MYDVAIGHPYTLWSGCPEKVVPIWHHSWVWPHYGLSSLGCTYIPVTVRIPGNLSFLISFAFFRTSPQAHSYLVIISFYSLCLWVCFCFVLFCDPTCRWNHMVCDFVLDRGWQWEPPARRFPGRGDCLRNSWRWKVKLLLLLIFPPPKTLKLVHLIN